MSSQLITKLDNNFSNYSTDITYPHILLGVINSQPLPVVIEYLEDGDVPLYYTQDGVTYELKRVDKSPLNLLKLLKVYPFTWVAAENTEFEITDTITLLEGLKWTPSLS